MTGVAESEVRGAAIRGPSSKRALREVAIFAAFELFLAWLLARGLIELAGRVGGGSVGAPSATPMAGMALRGHTLMAHSGGSSQAVGWVAVGTCVASCTLAAVLRLSRGRSCERGPHAARVPAIGAGACLAVALVAAAGSASMASHLVMMASLMMAMALGPALAAQAIYLTGAEPIRSRPRRAPILAATGYSVLVVCWHLPDLMDSIGEHPVVRMSALLVGFALGLRLWAALLDASVVKPATRRITILVAGVPSGLIGLALLLANKPIMAMHSNGLLPPVADQRWGGLLMMVVDAVLLVPAWFATERALAHATSSRAPHIPTKPATPAAGKTGIHEYQR